MNHDSNRRAFCVCLLLAALTVGCEAELRNEAEKEPIPSMTGGASPAASEGERNDYWPRFGGPKGANTTSETGHSTTVQAASPRVLWRRPAGKGYSSPIVTAGAVILLDRIGNEEVVHCHDRQTGDEIWRFASPTSFENVFEYSNGPASTPLVHDGRVYSLGAEGRLHCLDLSSGDLAWSKDLQAIASGSPRPFGYGASPVMLAGKLIVNAGSDRFGAICAFAHDTGDLLWSSGPGDASYATPAAATVDGTTYIVGLTDSHLVVIRAADGKLTDSVPFRSRVPDSEAAASPIVVSHRLFITARGLGSRCYEISAAGKLTELWSERRGFDNYFNTMSFTASSVIGFSVRGKNLQSISLATGVKEWEIELEDFRGNFIRSGNRLLILGESGRLFVVQIDGNGASLVYESAKPLLESPCYSSIAAGDGVFWLRNEKEIVAIAFKPADGN